MRTEHLQYFLNLAETGSIMQTSRELYTTHQNVSKLIRQLEEDLGTTLFLRTQKGVTLTATGKLLLPLAKRTVQEFAQLRADVATFEKHETLSGELHLLCSDMVNFTLIPSLMQLFTELYPTLHIQVNNAEVLTVLKNVALHPNLVGIAVVLRNPEFEQLYQPYLQQVELSPILQDTYYCLVNDESPLAGLKSVSLAQFVQHPFLASALDEDGENILTRLVKAHGGNVAFSTNNIQIYCDMLTHGRYVAVTSKLAHKKNIKNTLQNESLQLIPFQEDLQFDVAVITNRHAQLNEASQAFVDFASKSKLYL